MNKLAFLPLCFLLAGCSSPVNENPVKSKTDSSKAEESSIQESSMVIIPMSYKVLFIGNNFTHYNDLEKVSKEIATSAGLDFDADRVAISAHHLYEYATAGDEGAKEIASKLEATQYTHIILQEHSTYPVSNYGGFLSGARSLAETIKAKQPNADIRLYQTWGFQNMVGNYGDSIATCEQALCKAYQDCAKALDLKIHYVGKAFTKWIQDYPTQSPYYSGDNKHPSFLGTYLSGLIHVKSLTGVDLSKVTYQGKQGRYNNYGETYVSDTNKANLIQVAEKIYKDYGTNY